MDHDAFYEASGALDARIAAALAKLALAGRHALGRRAAESSLSPIQSLALGHLARFGPAQVGELASRLAVTAPTASDSVAALARKGLVTRRTVAGDARRVEVHLTPRGRRLASRQAAWPEVFGTALADLRPEEKPIALRFLLCVIARLVEGGIVRDARMCVTCDYFRPYAHGDEAQPHHCALVDLPLSDEHLRVDCPEHVAVAPAALRERLRVFRGGAGGRARRSPARGPSARGLHVRLRAKAQYRTQAARSSAASSRPPPLDEKEKGGQTSMTTLAGYTMGQPNVPEAPISWAEFEELKKSVLFDEEDANHLRMAGEILVPRLEELLDVWYGFVGSNPHLVKAFARKSDGKPDEGYLGAVRKRFGQWVKDTCAANFDQKWLDYQFEIGRRHHRSGKNATDGVDAEENVPMRHIIALIAPITLTVKPFLEKSGRSAADVEKMHAAWLKAVTLQAALWCWPYVTPGDF